MRNDYDPNYVEGQPQWKPTAALQPITPVGDNSVIEVLEKVLPYSGGETNYLVKAQLEAYKSR